MFILVVDDNDPFARLMSIKIAKFGHDVKIAGNGQEALKVLDDGPKPGLIFLDINMPVMDGETFLATLLSQQRLTEMPIILMSNDENVKQIAHKFSIKESFLKTDLVPILEQVIKNHSTSNQ